VLTERGGHPKPANYRGCSHAKEEMLRRKSQIPKYGAAGSLFSLTHVSPDLPFAAPQASPAEEEGRGVTQPTVQQKISLNNGSKVSQSRFPV